MAQKLVMAGKVVRGKDGRARLIVGPLKKRKGMKAVRVIESPDADKLNRSSN